MKMSLEDVHVKVCQQEIVKLDLQIKAVIQDISTCEGPLDALQDLNYDAREKLQNLKHRIEELERIAHEQDKEQHRIILQRDVENHRKQMASTQSYLRKANLACQLRIEKMEKEDLLGGRINTVRARRKSGKEELAKSASNVTENLMKLSRMLASQVQESNSTMNTLVSSSKQVTETHEEFKSMSGHIQNSKRLLTKYSRRECTDKLLIFLALVFFFATILYIVKKRLWGVSSAVPPSEDDLVT